MPFGLGDAGSSFTGLDVTAQRALDTTYAADSRRRLIIASVICSATMLGQAMAGYSAEIGGILIAAPRIVGLALGLVATGRFALVFPVDPEGSYSITTNLGTGASVILQQWLEVDF